MTHLSPLPNGVIEPIVRLALNEDLGQAGDVTSNLTIASDITGNFKLCAREAGVICGIDAVMLAMRLVDDNLEVTCNLKDGDHCLSGDVVFRIKGNVRAIMMVERVVLNFLGRLSGVATLTSRFVAQVKDEKAQILCTRKTTPGLRALEKQAVRAGGGVNHRFSLADGVLIKDNHIAVAGGVVQALRRARNQIGYLQRIEIEVDTLEQLQDVMPHSPDAVLLDNMSTDQLRRAVEIVDGRAITEASGGITLDTVRDVAKTGVDYISIGALTHSAFCLNFGLDPDI